MKKQTEPRRILLPWWGVLIVQAVRAAYVGVLMMVAACLLWWITGNQPDLAAIGWLTAAGAFVYQQIDDPPLA